MVLLTTLYFDFAAIGGFLQTLGVYSYTSTSGVGATNSESCSTYISSNNSTIMVVTTINLGSYTRLPTLLFTGTVPPLIDFIFFLIFLPFSKFRQKSILV